MGSFQRWTTHHQFPRDQRILDEFQELCQQEWALHTKQLQQEPRLTHKIIKHIISLLPDEYIVHNKDHANAHLMVYCPNIYNNAAYNTWMDKATFHLLDKTPHQIKDEMRHNTPKQISKHYSKLLSFDKELDERPYNHCLRQHLRWKAPQQMLNMTWPNHFGHVSTPELWSTISSAATNRCTLIVTYDFSIMIWLDSLTLSPRQTSSAASTSSHQSS